MSNLGYLFFNDIYQTTNNPISINESAKRKLLNFKNIEQSNQLDTKSSNGFELFTTYPGLTTGTGLPHGIKGENEDFKIGCYFDFTTGLPTLPGSSVKGVLRSMFPNIEMKQKDNALSFIFKDELRDSVKAKWLQAQLDSIGQDDFFEKHYQPKEKLTSENIEKLYALTLSIFEGVKDHTKSEPEERLHSIYQRDIFEDAYIVQSKHMDGKLVGTDSITPHIQDGMNYAESQLKNPTPLLFLKVLPNVQFRFNFRLHNFNESITASAKEKLFKKILLTIGAGAKTNVGYGQFSDKPMVSINTSSTPNRSTESTENTLEQLEKKRTKPNFENQIADYAKYKKGGKIEVKCLFLEDGYYDFKAENGDVFTKSKISIEKSIGKQKKRLSDKGENTDHLKLPEVEEIYLLEVKNTFTKEEQQFSIKPLNKYNDQHK